jgi:3-demethoxyubiquinol 3-hydroxylase
MNPSLDSLLIAADGALRTLFAQPRARRASPADQAPAVDMSAQDRALAGALMRVNHVGEVCAQALYAAQALSTRDAQLRQQFEQAGQEEADHLAWTHQRLAELGARPRCSIRCGTPVPLAWGWWPGGWVTR